MATRKAGVVNQLTSATNDSMKDSNAASIPAQTSASNPTPFENEKFVTANGIQIAYDEFGNPEHPAIILIMALGTQMISWTEEFCNTLASHGFRVVRFDNRDVGLSAKIDYKRRISLPGILLRSRFGLPFKVPYQLNDMAQDTVGLMDALGINKAHIVGASMGGMIAQLIAALHAERCLSLTSIMSTTGNRRLPRATREATQLLINRPQDPSEETAIRHGLNVWSVIGSPAYPPEPEDLKERLRRSWRRSVYPRGYRHQMAAIVANGDRRRLLKKITAPTLVIHGNADVLVPVEGGIDTAKNIPGARLEIIDGMGHDLPQQLIPQLTELIATHAKKKH